jgi:hypothetical protein
MLLSTAACTSRSNTTCNKRSPAGLLGDRRIRALPPPSSGPPTLRECIPPIWRGDVGAGRRVVYVDATGEQADDP